MNVTLSPELQKFVDQKIVAGEYTNASQVVREALNVLRAQETLSEGDIHEMRQDVAIGLSQLDSGQTAEFTAKQVQTLGRRVLKARNAKKELIGKNAL